MERLISTVGCLLIPMLATTWAVPPGGTVLCQKRSGVLALRTACKKKETAVDVAALGLMGPQGEPGAPGVGPLTSCADDAVLAGTVCLDKYEASVWRVPSATTDNQELVAKIQTGVVTAEELTAAGATQLGIASDDYAPCADNGQTCADDIYAVSLPGVTPSAFVTWFQAQVACKNARKRLPSNAEWQAGVVGTPDPGPDNGTTDCNSGTTASVSATGSRSACVSADGAFDMVGNLYEWVADWVPRSVGCGTWSTGVSPTSDYQCLVDAATAGEPGALLRGGNFVVSSFAGPLAVDGGFGPARDSLNFGFRCAR